MHRALDGLDIAWVPVVPAELRNVNTPGRPANALTWVSMTISEVNVDELERALRSGGRLVDVREIDEYEAGHVPGAVPGAARLGADQPSIASRPTRPTT